MRERHPLNASGDFYVLNGECISCGAPEYEAHDLMTHTESEYYHCYFMRQPKTPDEMDSAIRATWASCCEAVRYGGKDHSTLVRLAELGLTKQCDHPLTSVKPVRRNAARFRYSSPDVRAKETISAILSSLSNGLSGDYSRISNTDKTSLRYHWSEYSIRIAVTQEGDTDYRLVLSENEMGEKGVAGLIDKILQKNSAFQSITWFDRDNEHSGKAWSHPY